MMKSTCSDSMAGDLMAHDQADGVLLDLGAASQQTRTKRPLGFETIDPFNYRGD